MLLIGKYAEPRELADARKALSSTPGAKNDYMGLDSDTRVVVAKSLLEEQGYVCAYCMRRISEDNVEIEHYLVRHPSDAYRDNMRRYIASGSMNGRFDPDYDADVESLDYRNMLAVCNGGEGKPASMHTCDVARNEKANQDEPLCVDPLDPISIGKIKYSNKGAIRSDDPAIDHDLNDVLRLNNSGPGSRSFVENRRAVLLSLQRDVAKYCQRHGKKSKQHYCESRYNQILGAKQKPEYAGILLWQLKRWMR